MSSGNNRLEAEWRINQFYIADQGDGSKKVTVKARLHQLLEITRLVLEATIQRKRSSKPLGKGLKKREGRSVTTEFQKERIYRIVKIR